MLGVTRYKVTRYCNSTTFSGNEHVTKYIYFFNQVTQLQLLKFKWVCYSHYTLSGKINACRQEDSVISFLFSSRTVIGKHRGDDFLQGRSLCLPSGSNTFQVLSWSGNNTRELCCIWRSRHLYSQPNCSLYCALTARSTTVNCFALLPLPFIHLLQTCRLPHSHSPTHTSRTALFLKGATPFLQQTGLL